MFQPAPSDRRQEPLGIEAFQLAGHFFQAVRGNPGNAADAVFVAQHGDDLAIEDLRMPKFLQISGAWMQPILIGSTKINPMRVLYDRILIDQGGKRIYKARKRERLSQEQSAMEPFFESTGR